MKKDKQRFTKHYTESWRSSNTNPTKNRGKLRCSGRVRCSFPTCGNRPVNLVTNPVISHEWWRDRIVITTNGTDLQSCVTEKLRNGKPSHGGDQKTLENGDFNLTTRNPWPSNVRVSSNLNEILIGNTSSVQIGSTEIYILHMHCQFRGVGVLFNTASISNIHYLFGIKTPT